MPNPSPAIVFATRSGGTTLDQDDQGGNPFATALIRVAGEPGVSWPEFPVRLRDLTVAGSGGHQTPEWARWSRRRQSLFNLPAMPDTTRRIALVLIVSDYSHIAVAPLRGAAIDQRRVASLLASHGFSVTQGVRPDRNALLRALVQFRQASRSSDEAVVYSTGHGVEHDGEVYLLPGGYPIRESFSQVRLRRHAISVSQIADACRATGLNLVFFAGCRRHV